MRKRKMNRVLWKQSESGEEKRVGCKGVFTNMKWKCWRSELEKEWHISYSPIQPLCSLSLFNCMCIVWWHSVGIVTRSSGVTHVKRMSLILIHKLRVPFPIHSNQRKCSDTCTRHTPIWKRTSSPTYVLECPQQESSTYTNSYVYCYDLKVGRKNDIIFFN